MNVPYRPYPLRYWVWSVGFIAALSCSGFGFASPLQGDIYHPVVVDAFPYIHQANTLQAPSRLIDTYSCTTNTPSGNQTGGEFIYEIDVLQPCLLSAWLEVNHPLVDVHVHILRDLEIHDFTANHCLAHGDKIAETFLSPGFRYVVVDSSYNKQGPYKLHLECIGDQWIDRERYEGVHWRAIRTTIDDHPQVIHELLITPSTPSLSIRSVQSQGCQTIGEIATSLGAVAAVNGGYFASDCSPVSLLKSQGNLLGTSHSSRPRGAFGITKNGRSRAIRVPAHSTWTGTSEVQGGGPLLVANKVPFSKAADWKVEGFKRASFLGKNPRTVAGNTVDGTIVFFTVDGRRPSAAGMSMRQLATFAASLNLKEAVNLDGGGSSSIWYRGATPNGVVNYPSDGGVLESADHSGSRPVSGGFFVFAKPKNHPPRFQSLPIRNAVTNELYHYDVNAIDLELDTVTYQLSEAPPTMEIDSVSGRITWLPDLTTVPEVRIVIRATDKLGAPSEQEFWLTIDGAQGTSHHSTPH
jgi:hypothetical protein